MLVVRRILHPSDFSESSGPAFELSCSLARDYKAELVVCHVTPPPIAPVVDGMVVDIPTDAAEQAREQLERIKPVDANIEMSRRVGVGDAVHEILRIAKEKGADLIVMGTHGRGGISRLLLGSVAEGVMRNAPCPVLTIRSTPTVDQPKKTKKHPLANA